MNININHIINELKDDDLIYLIKINPLLLDKLCYLLSLGLQLQLEKENS